MVQTLLPRDAHNQAVQTLAPVTADTVAIGAASAVKGADFTVGVKIVELRPTSACFVTFGGSAAVATVNDFYLHAGERVTYHVGTNTRVAVLQESSTGTLHVTELA